MNKVRVNFSLWAEVFIFLILFCQCKNIQLAELHPYPELKTKLPALLCLNNNTSSFTNAASPNYVSSFNSAYYSSFNGGNIYQDAISLYNRDLEDNLTSPIGEKYGYALFKTVIGQNRYKGWGLYTGSIFTLGIPNLLGMPCLFGVTILEVEINILNSKKELIAKYTGEGYSKVPVALYYGYNLSSALREANLRALKMALKTINLQIEKDASVIKDKLIESGPLPK